MSTDYAPASETLTAHNDGWGIFAPKWIICHGTAGFQTAQQVADYFLSNNPPSSTHYVVGRDGAVVQCVRESQAAWGNGPVTGPAGNSGGPGHNTTGQHDAWWDTTPIHNCNPYTLSIEHVKPSEDNSDHLTPEQQAASFALILHLCEAHSIPTHAADANGGITGHFSMDPINRSDCPGPYPWDALWAFLNGGGSMGFQRQPDKSGKDDHGHHCGEGIMNKIEADHITANGKRSETYKNGLGPVKSFLTLENGQTLTWDGSAVGYDSADVIEGYDTMLQAHDATIKDLTAKNAQATSDLVNADRTITDLKQQLANAQAQPPLTPKQQAAVALGQALDAYAAAK